MSKTFYSNNGQFQNSDKKLHKQHRKMSWLKITLLSLCTVLILAVVGVGGFVLHNNRAESDFQKLSEQSCLAATAPAVTVSTAAISTKASEAFTEPNTDGNPDAAAAFPAMESREILPQYKELYEQNHELFGWLTIPDTKIDYPVMYTPGESEKYLHAAFDGSYSYAGTPFIDINCQPNSQNLMIYAHNMPNGSMFRNLLKFQEKTYWEKHPTITFNTIYEENQYEIVAAFYDRLYLLTETDVFKFYYFIDPETEEEFDNGIREIKAKALYDTGVEVNYGDKLITLVTCAYHTTHGRFAVLARQITDE